MGNGFHVFALLVILSGMLLSVGSQAAVEHKMAEPAVAGRILFFGLLLLGFGFMFCMTGLYQGLISKETQVLQFLSLFGLILGVMALFYLFALMRSLSG